MRASSLARAMELDDSFPDDVCPGCKQAITGWQMYPLHGTPASQAVIDRLLVVRRYRRREAPWPFFKDNRGPGGYPVCVWNRDFLLARRFRRAYIAEHTAVAS